MKETYEDIAWVSSMVKEELEAAGLSLNDNKTRVKFEKFGARRILGVNVTKQGILPTRKTNRKVRAVAHQLKYSADKRYVYSGLRMWQTCPMPKGAGFAM